MKSLLLFLLSAVCWIDPAFGDTPLPPVTNYVTAIEVDSGRLLWRFPFQRTNHFGMAAYSDGLLLSSWDEEGARTNLLLISSLTGSLVSSKQPKGNPAAISRNLFASNNQVGTNVPHLTVQLDLLGIKSHLRIANALGEKFQAIEIGGIVEQARATRDQCFVCLHDGNKKPNASLIAYSRPQDGSDVWRPAWQLNFGTVRRQSREFKPGASFEILGDKLVAEAGGLLYEIDRRTGRILRSLDYAKEFRGLNQVQIHNTATAFIEVQGHLIVVKKEIIFCLLSRDWSVKWAWSLYMMGNYEPAALADKNTVFVESGYLAARRR
jgi:hypothetical protein